MAADTPESAVRLVEITRENFRAVASLRVRPDQDRFVAPSVWSIAESSFAPEAWMRAIFVGDEPVGFVLLDHEPENQLVGLWRFMIAADHQARGHGRRALELVLEHARVAFGARRMQLSFIDEDGGPEAFYAGLGFRRTGVMHGIEPEMALDLGPPSLQ